MELCDTCQAFDIQAFDPVKFPVRGYKLLSAISAAESGCPFCSLLIKARFPQGRKQGVIAVLQNWPEWIYLQGSEQWESWLESQYNRKDNNNTSSLEDPLGLLRLWAIGSTTFRRNDLALCQFQILADEDSPAAINGDVAGRLLDTETGSDGHIQMLSSWLQQCQENHEECRTSFSGSRLLNPEATDLPNRCIEVSLDSDGARALTLKETGGCRGKYITLTHRWIQPDTANASTLQSNYSERLRGEGLEYLPSHFEDAFYLALKMGIPFVWIDSLCIIQDSEQDWIVEAARMATYYQNSFFTVAGFGVTRETGLFTACDQESLPNLVRLPYRDREGIHKGYFYVRQVNHSDIREQYDQEIAQSELLRRGWIFQEWILSRRMICFTRTACFFQCQRFNPRTTASNDFNLTNLDTRDASISLNDFFSQNFLELSCRSIFDKWRFAVHTYSSLRLTKISEDRLTALAGISEEFALAINCSIDAEQDWYTIYLSGMWAGDIIVGLLWETDSGCPGQRLSGIPTWSWASVIHPVVWQQDHRRMPKSRRTTKTLSEFLGAKKTSVDEQLSASESDLTIDAYFRGRILPADRFVTPQYNTLVMQGKLLSVRIDGLFDSDSDLDIAASLSGYEIDSEQNLQTGSITVPGTRTREYWRKIALSQFPEVLCGWVSIDDLVASSEPVLLDVLALPLTETTVDVPGFGLGYFWSFHQAYSILLLRRIAESSSAFERIGVGRIFGSEAVDQVKSADETKLWLV